MALLGRSDRIFVAGHRGLVGSAILRRLEEKGYQNLLVRNRRELDLTKQDLVEKFFYRESPDVVFLAAAKVGGISANNNLRADFVYENLSIQNNVIWSAFRSGTHRLIFLGSSCIYPKHASQPIQEESLLCGPLEPTNRPYAIAKIAGLELIDGLRRQYNMDYFSVMPTNLYGPHDNYHPDNSHVLPALIRKFLVATRNNLPAVELWGSGTPLREFLHSDDCARAIVSVAETLTKETFDESRLGRSGISYLNVGSDDEISIAELARSIAELTGFRGEIIWNDSMPDGTPRKKLDSSALREIGWKPEIKLRDGIMSVIRQLEEEAPRLDWLS